MNAVSECVDVALLQLDDGASAPCLIVGRINPLLIYIDSSESEEVMVECELILARCNCNCSASTAGSTGSAFTTIDGADQITVGIEDVACRSGDGSIAVRGYDLTVEVVDASFATKCRVADGTRINDLCRFIASAVVAGGRASRKYGKRRKC